MKYPNITVSTDRFYIIMSADITLFVWLVGKENTLYINYTDNTRITAHRDQRK